MKKILLLVLLAALALPAAAEAKTRKTAPAQAEPATTEATRGPAKLSAHDQADVYRIEFYLNGLKNISADFMQIDDHGGVLRGKLEIQRPGKMRAVYNPPSTDFIIADGKAVHIWNGQLQSQTNVDETSSLADFILRDPIRLNDDVIVTKFQRFPAKIELTLAQANDPAAGQLTLIFEDHPLILRQWRVIDPEGHTTGVNLENERMDVTFPANNFTFLAPNFGVSTKASAP